MATEVRHGPTPAFRSPGVHGAFHVRLVGHYTAMRQRGAGGATDWAFSSQQKAKRRNELLVLRTCFLEWYLKHWMAQGGSRRHALREVRTYPFKRHYGPRGGLRPTTHTRQRKER